MLKQDTTNRILNASLTAAALLQLDASIPPAANAADAPVLTGASFSGAQRNFQVKVQDPPGVLSYNLLYANNVNGPYQLAQTNNPVSGVGTTFCTDDGSLSGVAPSNPTVKSRFYRVQVNSISASVPLAQRLQVSPPTNSFLNYESQSKPYVFANLSPIDLHYKVQSPAPWLTISPTNGTVPCRANVPVNAPYHLTKSCSYPNQNWQFGSPVGVGVRNDDKVFILDVSDKVIKILNSSGQQLHGVSFPSMDGSSHIAFDTAKNIYVTYAGGIAKFGPGGAFIRNIGVGVCNRLFDIAVDSSGNIFVSDGGLYQVHKFDLNGNHLTSWGSHGVGNGQFTHPALMAGIMGLAIDGSGNVYVADAHYRRVQKFDNNGNFLGVWKIAEPSLDPNQDWQLGEILAYSSAANGIYVAHEHDSAIQLINLNMTLRGSVTSPYALSGNTYMRDAGVNAAGTAYSISGSGDVYQFNAAGPLPGAWGPHIGTNIFNGKAPGEARVNSTGAIYALIGDYAFSPSAIAKYDANGAYQTSILSNRNLSAMAIAKNDEIHVATSTGLVILNTAHQVLVDTNVSGIYWWGVEGMDVDGAGRVCLVPDWNSSYILQRINRQGTLLDSWPKPAGIYYGEKVAVDSKGTVYIQAKTPGYDEVILKYSDNGVLLNQWPVGSYTFSPNLFVDNKDNILVGVYGGFRKFSPDGTLLLSQTTMAGSLYSTVAPTPQGDIVCCATGPDRIDYYTQAAVTVQVSANLAAPELLNRQTNTTFSVFDNDALNLTPLKGNVRIVNGAAIP